MDPTRFDEFLVDDAPQIDSIKTQLLNANPMIGSVKALLNVVRGKSNPEATTLLHDAYGFPLADASALAGLLAAYQGGNI
jgi:ornithine cyclodeaminase/alanine dehydrogenase-like protein (mu-crystallin family)